MLSHTLRMPRLRASFATAARSTSFSSGLVGVSTQMQPGVGTQRRLQRGRIREVDERHAQSRRALAHVLQEPVAAPVQVVHGDDVRAGIQQLEQRRGSGHAGGEGEGGGAALEVRERRLQGVARRVVGARVLVALVHAGTGLHVGRGRVDRRHHRAGERDRGAARRGSRASRSAARESRHSCEGHPCVSVTACGAASSAGRCA